MKFKLEIDCDNAAFDIVGGNPSEDISHILRDVAGRMECNPICAGSKHHNEYRLYDVNGNRVGRAWIEE
jgi:hypothetical protein